ncbi:MAG: hypothetical protein U0570_02645 [Phycisphaerales bacterium]
MNSLWFILIVVGFNLIGWLIKKAGEQAEKRRRDIARKSAEMEALRTGRATETAQPERMDDSDQRRRQELAELRRRAAARREPTTSRGSVQQPTGTSAPSPLEILLNLPPGSTSGGTVSPRPARLPKASKKSKAARIDPEIKRQREEAERRKQQLIEQQAAEARRREAQRTRGLGTSLEQRLLRDAKALPVNAPAGADSLTPRTAAEWRRAIAMNEILSRPVTLR